MKLVFETLIFLKGFCKQRYYRTNKGVCVKRTKCPKIKAKPTKKPKPVIKPTPTTKQITTKKPKTKRPKTTKKPKPGSGSQKELSDGDCATNERAIKCGSRCKELCENADKAKPCPPNEKCEIGCVHLILAKKVSQNKHLLNLFSKLFLQRRLLQKFGKFLRQEK